MMDSGEQGEGGATGTLVALPTGGKEGPAC